MKYSQTDYKVSPFLEAHLMEATRSLAWQIGDSGKLEEMSGEELRQAVKELMADLLSDFPPGG